LVQFYEENEAIRQIVAASPLPVIVDAGDGFGDVKNVTRTVRGYEELGAAAVFIEDQQSPISCGQMGKKEVIPVHEMAGKVKAALAARRRSAEDFHPGADRRAQRRGTSRRPSAAGRPTATPGADGVYVEGLRSAGGAEAGRQGPWRARRWPRR